MSDKPSQLNQKVVYVRVTKMYLPQSNPNVSRNLFQQIQPGYSGVISPLIPIQMLDMYSSSAILAFRFYDQKKSNITFIVTELTQVGENEVCRLCLPLSWFPHGYVVHHYFPFITRTPQNGKPFIELDVHIADVQTTPFSAYYGTLTVIPTWIPPPQMTAGATVLVTTPIRIQNSPIPYEQTNQQSTNQQNPAQPKPHNISTKENKQHKKKEKHKNKNKDDQTKLLNKNDHQKETSSDDDIGEDSEIQLDDLDDILNDESLNQVPPPVLDPSQITTEEEQESKKAMTQQPQQPQQQFQQQQQSQRLQQQLQQPQQQFQQQQLQPQQRIPPNSQHQKIRYPPFPPFPNQVSTNQQSQQQPLQNNDESK